VAGDVGGDEFWMVDRAGHVSVGWPTFAAYEIDVRGERAAMLVTHQASPSEAAVAFVFSVLPLLLPLWSIEPFHGSAVLADAGAVVVLGPSRAGKSSIAAGLERRGLPLLADDTCAFDANLNLWPGPAAINPRWADALQPPVGKYNEKEIRAPTNFSDDPVVPAAIVVLDPGEDCAFRVDQPTTDAKLRGILTNARHGTFMLDRRSRLQFEVATQLAGLPLVVIRLDPRHGPERAVHALSGWLDGMGMSPPVEEPP
jgi:hypothetical protein